MEWAVDVRAGIADQADVVDLEFGPCRIDLPGRFTRQVRAHYRTGQSRICRHSVTDHVIELDEPVPARGSDGNATRAPVRLLDDLQIRDVDRVDHEQAQVLDEQRTDVVRRRI